MNSQALTPEQERVIAKAEKIFALAKNNPNEHEAEAAMRMGLKLLEDHNLDMAQIGSSGKGQQRSDSTLKGGLYGWQRKLWKDVAELNFCRYWSLKGLAKGSVYEHRILGSKVNVLSARLMAEYLQQAVERNAQAWAKDRGYNVFQREAIAYREGMASRICERLREAREERKREDERKAREAATRAAHPSAAPGTALVVTVAQVQQTEEDLNTDYEMGLEPGTTAQRRAEREYKRQLVATEREFWEQGDRFAFVQRYGEERALVWEERDRRQAKINADYELYLQGKPSDTFGKPSKPRASRSTGGGYRSRKPTPEEERAQMREFSEGRRKGEEIRLDKQIDEEKKGRLA